MSPIADIQSRFRELGRIRLGYQEDTGQTYTSGPKKGQPKKRPAKLDRFRLTSPWQHLIDEAADLYGGTAEPWDNQGGAEHQVVIEQSILPVVIPVGGGLACLDQWYELWDGSGLARRCDGLKQAPPNLGGPCACPADPNERTAAAAEGKACRPTSRLRVMLPALSDLGTWRLETHGFYAATELAPAGRILDLAGQRGATFIPAQLCLQPKEGARRPGQPRRKFYVPAISFDFQLGAVLDSLDAVTRPDSIAPATSGELPAAPTAQRSIIDQLYDEVTRRAGALDVSDKSRLVSWGLDQKPAIVLQGRRVSELAQSEVQAIQTWLDAHDARTKADAEDMPPCVEESV